MECSVKAILVFDKVERLVWDDQGSPPTIGGDGKINWGAFDSPVVVEGGMYVLRGDFGAIRVRSQPPSLQFCDNPAEDRQEPLRVRLTQRAGLALILSTAVALGVHAVNASYSVEHQRALTCNGMLPMPAAPYWYGWTGMALAVAVLIVALARLAHHKRVRSPQASLGFSAVAVGVSFLAAAVLALALLAVYSDAPTTPWLCE